MLNWIIGGSDAHAKNYSMLIGAGGQARLAPLYDIASALPYDDIDQRKLRMAMKVGGKYRLDEVFPRHWAGFAEEVRLPSKDVLDMGRVMTDAIPPALTEAINNLRDHGVDHPILRRMGNDIVERAKTCARILRYPLDGPAD